VHLSAAGERAARLPGLLPDAGSLEVLARPLSPATWITLRRDPAALLLAARVRSVAPGTSFTPARLLEPRILETACDWLRTPQAIWLDPRQSTALPVYETALAIAHHARILAELTRCCDARAATAAGLLAPLGWFAVAAVEPEAVAACRSDPAFADDPGETEARHWGLDHAAVARRLARHWRLSEGLKAVVGHLALSVPEAETFGADGAIFATVKLAALLARHAGHDLGLVRNVDEKELCRRLRIDADDLLTVADRFRTVDFAESFTPEWRDPRTIPDLPKLLGTTAGQRRAATAPFLAPLERDLDRMQRALEEVRLEGDERLRSAKLEAMAELAAGASHEINNPLAVISGQGQYLLNRSPDERHRAALESIVRQAHRIHGILTELMLFARPTAPVPQRISLVEVIEAALVEQRPLAEAAGVKLESDPADSSVWIDADPRQLRTALGGLVRNAIEAAAPGKGWVRVRAETACGRLRVVVEDGGPGLTPAQREHMFDPFYSGRPAGRGRGLGLPTAWRLARQNGGDVRYEPTAGGPTRFVLALPPPVLAEERRSA
jgi:two-component system NtrC family sensor kinase